MSDGNVAADQLRQFVERYENLSGERKAISDDMRDVLLEAKATGFVPKTIRQIVKLRAMEKAVRDEEAAMLELYSDTLGL